MTPKIPPPVLMLLTALIMWLLAAVTPAWARLSYLPWLSAVVAVGALALMAAGVWAFRRAATTVHPFKPDQTRQIVDSGVFAYSRNPMYLGMACLLAAWAWWLGALPAWLGVPLFVWIIGRWQIAHEEAVLLQKFGEPYRDYCRRVRRWL